MDYETRQPHLFHVEKQDHNSADLDTVISNSDSPTAAKFFPLYNLTKGLITVMCISNLFNCELSKKKTLNAEMCVCACVYLHNLL